MAIESDVRDIAPSLPPPRSGPHHDGHPSVLVRLAAVDREELAELLTDAWRVRAPKRLAATLDTEEDATR